MHLMPGTTQRAGQEVPHVVVVLGKKNARHGARASSGRSVAARSRLRDNRDAFARDKSAS
jgi:hypothetical protein